MMTSWPINYQNVHNFAVDWSAKGEFLVIAATNHLDP